MNLEYARLAMASSESETGCAMGAGGLTPADGKGFATDPLEAGRAKVGGAVSDILQVLKRAALESYSRVGAALSPLLRTRLQRFQLGTACLFTLAACFGARPTVLMHRSVFFAFLGACGTGALTGL